MTVSEVKVVVVGDSSANKTAILSHIAKASASNVHSLQLLSKLDSN
jgi:hypothetical protein